MKTRTTVTFDPDVAAEVERLRRERRAGLKEVVNDLMRRGIRDVKEPPMKTRPFRTKTFDAGKPLIPNIDNVAEVLAVLEGEDYK
jgi:hypothetical protein